MLFKYLKRTLTNYIFHNRALSNPSTHVTNQQMHTRKMCFIILLKLT